jgi:hypothetical protein
MKYRSTRAHKNERIAYVLWPPCTAGGGGAGAWVPIARSSRLDLADRPALTITRTRVNYMYKEDVGK